ncbi:MAG TPA: hypothetical protein VFE62_26030 [Gemmataceae bacterium]|nr:hypothetical protein [Gemmataceae bacterium]
MRIPRACLLLLGGCVLAIAGCKEDEDIRVNTVSHPDRQAIRLRAGVIKRDNLLWVFLIKGPKNEVAKNLDTFNELVRSVKFLEKKDDNGRPFEVAEWTNPPKNWRKDPPGEMRYAAYRIDAEPKEIEMTVSRLSAGDDWLLTNVNRWRKQVNLPPVAKDADLQAPEVVHEKEIAWVDLTGLGVHIVSKPPDPQAQSKKPQFPAQGKRPKVQPKAGGKKVPFQYDVPKGWEKGELTGQFMVERYVVDKDVQVTLTPLGGGDLAGNINRWRKEIGLPLVDKKVADDSAAVLKIAGVQSYYVDIDNPARSSRILGAIVPLDDAIWVVKMWGPSNRVGENKNGFETFVKSFKLDGR